MGRQGRMAGQLRIRTHTYSLSVPSEMDVVRGAPKLYKNNLNDLHSRRYIQDMVQKLS